MRTTQRAIAAAALALSMSAALAFQFATAVNSNFINDRDTEFAAASAAFGILAAAGSVKPGDKINRHRRPMPMR